MSHEGTKLPPLGYHKNWLSCRLYPKGNSLCMLITNNKPHFMGIIYEINMDHLELSNINLFIASFIAQFLMKR